MIKYIAYCRKSTDEPDRQILSIEAQVAELEEHAAKEGLKIVSFIKLLHLEGRKPLIYRIFSFTNNIIAFKGSLNNKGTVRDFQKKNDT